MVYVLLADLLLVLHLLFIFFVLFGGLLLWRWPYLLFVHMPALFWGVWVELHGGICPLTPWEQQLRLTAGQSGYTGGFVEHYIQPLIYPAGYDQALGYWLAAIVLIVNICAYAYCGYRYYKSLKC